MIAHGDPCRGATNTKLVDGVAAPDKVAQLIMAELGGIYPVESPTTTRSERWEHPRVAVIYADGDITDVPGAIPLANVVSKQYTGDPAVGSFLELRVVKYTGDGVLAVFDGPGRAIRCALALRTELRGIGIEIRAGLHTGELDLLDDDVGGIAVHIAARIMAAAGSGEVLVSRTVRDLVVGSGIALEDRGTHALKGLDEPWHLFAAG